MEGGLGAGPDEDSTGPEVTEDAQEADNGQEDVLQNLWQGGAGRVLAGLLG